MMMPTFSSRALPSALCRSRAAIVLNQLAARSRLRVFLPVHVCGGETGSNSEKVE